MEFRAYYVIFSIVLVVSLARNTVCLPKTQNFAVLNAVKKPHQKVIVHSTTSTKSPIPSCDHKGSLPVEDSKCAYCKSRGFGDGLCINN
ncbi:hypothetical protein evm_015513, partial [Chilo suppressalis]